MAPVHLDRWLPDPAVQTCHRRTSRLGAEELWSAALKVRLCDTRALGRLIRWRIPGTPPDRSFGELFRSYPFIVLEERPRLLVSGLCGRIWTLTRDYPALQGAEEFRAWRERGTARVLFAHWATDGGEGDAELVSEARIQPVDRAAGLRLRALWEAVGPFERLVGSEGLTAAIRAAEARRARDPRGASRHR